MGVTFSSWESLHHKRIWNVESGGGFGSVVVSLMRPHFRAVLPSESKIRLPWNSTHCAGSAVHRLCHGVDPVVSLASSTVPWPRGKSQAFNWGIMCLFFLSCGNESAKGLVRAVAVVSLLECFTNANWDVTELEQPDAYEIFLGTGSQRSKELSRCFQGKLHVLVVCTIETVGNYLGPFPHF